MGGLAYPEGVLPTLRFQHCPMCTTALTRKVLFDDGIPRVTCENCDWIQLVSNAVAVAVVVVCEEGIATITPPGEDGVGLPAGLVEYGESPEDAAIREVREETGLEATITDCLGWHFVTSNSWPGPMVQFLFEAQADGGALKGSDEGAATIHPLAQFPEIASGRAGSRAAMEAYRRKLEAHR